MTKQDALDEAVKKYYYMIRPNMSKRAKTHASHWIGVRAAIRYEYANGLIVELEELKTWISDARTLVERRNTMKAKGIKKLLMRGRTTSFWGRRAYITASIPIEQLGIDAPPVFDSSSVGKSVGFEGMFERQEGEFFIHTSISKISSGGKPSKEENAFFVEKSAWGGYEWWEILETVILKEGDNEEVVERRPGNSEILKAYRERELWLEKFGRRYIETGVPILDRFHYAEMWARAVYSSFDDRQKRLNLTYAVKWF